MLTGMTTPVQSYKLVDPSNHLLAVQDAVLTIGQVPVGDETRLAVTIRTPSCTVTVLLDKLSAEGWDKQFHREVQRMSGTGLVTSAAIPDSLLRKRG